MCRDRSDFLFFSSGGYGKNFIFFVISDAGRVGGMEGVEGGRTGLVMCSG